ncbi:hypothetical protein [Leucobacter triazinivorans]|jgi:hypothetical protein|uniref:DoxX family protein n=1 Tax=Leucobacter triazinivorans TaxID=1784719 RepID=A0A4P6KGU6_9MICO|nr:hypothetical protein [Leucobacter triazinivorans]QBE49562.1 hypothetical protein EVS81_12600 [Leucobacter triazinivorans]
MMTIAAVALTVMLGLLAVFQIALAAGVPLGKFAWGGQHATLPLNLRFGAVSAVFRYGFVAFIALDRSGTIAVLPEEFSFWVMWIVVAHFGLSVILSLLSASKYEKMTLAPYTLVMGLLSLLIALK